MRISYEYADILSQAHFSIFHSTYSSIGTVAWSVTLRNKKITEISTWQIGETESQAHMHEILSVISINGQLRPPIC